MAKFYDTLLWEYIQNPWARWLSLDKLALRDMNYEMISYDTISEKKKLNFKEVELEKAAIYSCEDVYITNKLYWDQEKKEVTEYKILNEIEFPVLQVIKQMEIDWVKIERNKLK